jgi:hypothetical protein
VTRTQGSSDQNLDPLLDTMANVVGILVMLVAVTQLSVSDAVERIKDQGPIRSVTRAIVEAAESEREQVEDALVSVRGKLAAMPPSAKRRGMLIEAATPVLDVLEALPDRAELRGLAATSLLQRAARETEEVARLEQEMIRKRQRVSGLDELLVEVPAEVRPKIARLPDPRPPRVNTTPVTFLVRYGRVVPVDVESLTKRLYAGVQEALGEARRPVRDDQPFLVNFFSKLYVGDEDFYWKFKEQGPRKFFADIGWSSKDRGEGLANLRIGDSDYSGVLRQHRSRLHFVRFWVWSDSFETYLEARYIAERAGFDVSWQPLDAEDEIGIDIYEPSQTEVLID